MKKQLLSCLALALALTAGAQITLVKDINDGSSDSNPNDSYTFNGKTYFQADDSSGVNTGGVDFGDELWVTDGTTGGTMLFKNIRGTEDTGGGSTSSQPEGFFEYNGSLYLSATTDAGGQLFKLNATEDDLEEVTGVPGFNNSCELGGLIYFVYAQGPGLDNVLYVFDGTGASAVTNNSVGTLGTEHISSNTSAISSSYITAYNGKVYFYGIMSIDAAKDATDPTQIGYELYSYDPASGMFELVKDIMPGLNTTGSGPGNSGVNNLNVLNGKLYFKAETSGYLYESDGTEGGTIPVAAATTAGVDGCLSFYVWNDKIYFEGDADGSDQLWVFDPVADTVTQVSNVTGYSSHDPRYYTGVGADLFYVGRNGVNNTDWHIYRLKNGTDWSYIDATDDLDCEWLFELNGKLYFEGDDDGSANAYGTELYELDPTTLSASDVRLKGIAAAYPNPAKDYITVDKSLVNGAYSIYDVTGKAVKQGVLQSQKINLNLNTGFYIFKAQTDSGFYTQKLIVK
ncbi:T9SS type A sorting domain-containing protein [Flavobacteriaceae bacterium SZ-1-7]|uniref:T9SS type A sorting domain-containing protein n=1 Tax=Tamlana sedimenti TaxID=3134126 RepID=UPI003123AABF